MKLITSLLISLFSILSNSDGMFPLDQSGKYTFNEIVEVSGLSKDDLYKNGALFMKKIKVLNTRKKYLVKDKENFTLINKGSFYVYRLGSIKKAIDGAVEYDIKLEIKDGKYRYTITNFIYNEYKRNRYGQFEPTNGKFYPLEMEMTNLNKKEWEKHREIVYEKTQELIRNLYAAMIYIEDTATRRSKKEVNW